MSDLEMNCKEVWLVMQKSRPTIGKTLIYTDRMLRVAGEYSGLVPISIVGRVLGGVGRIVLMSNRQRVGELGAQLAGIHDLDDLSPDDMELLDEMLALQNNDPMDQIAESFQEIKDILAALTEKVVDIQEQLTEMHYAAEYKQILTHYTNLMKYKARGNLSEWALYFYQNITSFQLLLSGFSKDNVTSYLKKIYEQKCTDSMDPMYETYKFIVHARSLYLDILVAYYENIPEEVKAKLPDLDPYERILDEIEAAEKEVLDINAAANDAFSGFFMAAFTSHPSWKLGLKFIPDIDDIPKTAKNCKKTTGSRLQHGRSQAFFGRKVNLYKQEGSNFARLHYIKNNKEYINSIRPDGCWEDGIYRERTENGDTEIGSHYHLRWGRKEGNVYLLKRLNASGINIILYQDLLYQDLLDVTQVYGVYETVKEYSFNEETNVWTKRM